MAARNSLYALHKRLHDQKDRALADAFRCTQAIFIDLSSISSMSSSYITEWQFRGQSNQWRETSRRPRDSCRSIWAIIDGIKCLFMKTTCFLSVYDLVIFFGSTLLFFVYWNNTSTFNDFIYWLKLSCLKNCPVGHFPVKLINCTCWAYLVKQGKLHVHCNLLYVFIYKN
jgi:hypothetical protein